MLTISLVLNILVLVPLCTFILRDVQRIEVVYGARTPARDILLCVYLSILLSSVALLVMVNLESTWGKARWAAVALLGVQIIYKLLTTLLVREGKPPRLAFNPVVASNFGISLMHVATVAVVFSVSSSGPNLQVLWG